MKYILIIPILLFFCLSSKAQLNVNELKKDPDFTAYLKVVAKMKANMLSHYYGPAGASAALPAELAKAKSDGDMRVIVKKNGMLHGDEFVDLLISQTTHMNNFIKNHPELIKLSPEERNKVLMKMLASNTN